MKRLIAVLLSVIILFTLLCGCKDLDTASSNVSIGSDTQNDASKDSESLYSVIKSSNNSNDFYAFQVSYRNNFYYINNKKNDDIKKIFVQFEKHYIVETENFDYEAKNIHFIFRSTNDNLSININEKDQIEVNNENKYYSEGIYNNIVTCHVPIFMKNYKYYSLEYCEENFMYNYKIYDFEGNIIEGDTTPKKPHIEICDDNVVLFWSQGGTGTLTRTAYFIHTITGRKSPYYYGITDFYENLVLSSDANSVKISDMFSGTVFQTIDEFSMEPYNAIETILDTKFIENGTKVSVTYLANDLSKQTEIFKVQDQPLSFYFQKYSNLKLETFDSFCFYYDEKYYEIDSEQYTKELLKLFDSCYVAPSANTDYKNTVYHIRLLNPVDFFSFYIQSDDKVFMGGNTFQDCIYYKEGLFTEFENFLKPIMKSCDKFYSVEDIDSHNTQYKIFDINGNLIESDTIYMRIPHVSLRDEKIVCKWVQWGTGTLVRETNFYNTITGEKSPTYIGVVDNYYNLVASTDYASVTISNMFSGEVLMVIDKFENELQNGGVENITDVNFIENGTKIEVWYWKYDGKEVSQVFEIKF